MRIKLILLITSMAFTSAFAQNVNDDEQQKYIDWAEDSTEITTISDIIREQQEINSRNNSFRHFEEVWGRRGYFNIAYANSTLDPDGQIPTGIGNGVVSKFKSDWGASIQLGRSYRLHKKAIANTLQFNIDYTYIDLGVNHFKAADGDYLYDSSNKKTVINGAKTETYYYIPWNLEKYEANYSMSLGPSLTIAPFNYIKARGLHHMKFNAYYHIGYGVSFLYMKNKKEADLNQQNMDNADYKEMSDNLKLCWGHGLTSSFGFTMSWKVIGIGYEHRSATWTYKSMNTKEFEDDSNKFKSATNRVFIQFRM